MKRRSSTQDISWFLDLRRHDQIEMDPPYQRKSVWNPKDRRFFLDTVFRGYPCPPVFLHKTIDDEQQTVYAVVDGKQRLQTLFLFVDGELALPEDFGDDRFNGKTWDRLEGDEKQLFWDYVIPVEFLTFDPKDTKSVSQAFDRLNRNMRKLEAQELRHARWDGWFISLVESECEDSTWRDLKVVTNARAKRMKDAQFISELLLVLINGAMIGFDQQALDDAYAQYDDIDDDSSSIDPDGIKESLETAKKYLATMQDENGCIKEYASTLATFYTLWSIVALHRDSLPNAKGFAKTFAEFSERVGELKKLEDPAELGQADDKYNRPFEFLQAARGATTDLAPRTKRLDALLKYVEEASN